MILATMSAIVTTMMPVRTLAAARVLTSINPSQTRVIAMTNDGPSGTATRATSTRATSSCGISTCRRPTGGGVSLPGHELVRRRPPQVPPAARRTAPRATGMDAAGALPARADEDCEASGDRVDHAISQIRTAGDSVSMTTERRHDGPDLMHRYALADLRKNHSSIYLRGVRPTLGSWIREFRHCVGRPPARSRRDSAGLTALPLKTHNAFLEASLFVLGGRHRASLRPCHSGCGDELRGPGVRSCVHDC